MADLSTLRYFQRREVKERELSHAAHDPRAAAVHQPLADFYAELAAGDAGPNPCQLAMSTPPVLRR